MWFSRRHISKMTLAICTRLKNIPSVQLKWKSLSNWFNYAIWEISFKCAADVNGWPLWNFLSHKPARLKSGVKNKIKSSLESGENVHGFRGGKYDWVSTWSFDKAAHWRLAALRDRLQYVILSVQLISIRKFFRKTFFRLWWSVVVGEAGVESSVVSLLLKRPSSLAFLLCTVSVGLQLVVINRLAFQICS